jgi:hypothetical protein
MEMLALRLVTSVGVLQAFEWPTLGDELAKHGVPAVELADAVTCDLSAAMPECAEREEPHRQ